MQIADQLKQNLGKFFSLAAISFVLFSCSDSGCIDADDFGEYESQTITVSANAQQENCTYNSSLELTDSEQGSSIRNCLAVDKVTVIKEDTSTETSPNGCQGFLDLAVRNICINNCIQNCLSAVGSSSSIGAEPTWNSTDKKESGQNIGVTIRPGSQVMVRATGNITLGRTVAYPDIFVKANNPVPHSYNSSGGNNFFDVRNGQALTLAFSGSTYIGPENSDVNLGESNNSYDLYNLAKRLVIYTIPHPEQYAFDISADTEKEGSNTVPLLPDPRAWECNYEEGGDQNESTCGNSSYKDLGYDGVDDDWTNSTFPISSASKLSGVTQYGGIVRVNSDGLQPTTYDPFVIRGVTCDTTTVTCSTNTSVPESEGKIVGDISSESGFTFENKFGDAYAVSFRSLIGDVGCNDTKLNVSILLDDGDDKDDNDITHYSGSNLSNIAISNSWTTTIIPLEPGQKLKIDQNLTKYGSSGISCGNVIGMRLLKYHDLTMQQSGFVRFAILGGSDTIDPSGSCIIEGRIINPDGGHTDVSVDDTNVAADFYEYGTYDNSSTDPLNSLSIPASKNGSPDFVPGTSSKQIFVRKGQKIRFNPSTWDNTWTTTYDTAPGLTRNCGIGLAMSVEQRPALICIGSTSESVSNPDCVPQLGTDGLLIGCQAFAAECLDNTSASYCPYDACIDEVDEAGCIIGDNSNYYQRSCKFIGETSSPTAADSTACGTLLTNGGVASTDQSTVKSKCKSCSSLRLANANLAALISVNNISQCYDLENYTGKVANIPVADSSSILIDQITDFLDSSAWAKGTIKLSGFNGTYGNIVGFTDSGTISDDGKKIYNVTSSYIASTNSRLRAFILDGSTFVDSSGDDGAWEAYYNNSASDNIRIGFFGSLSFKNGQWMEVRLCQETSNDSDNPSYTCKAINPPNFASSDSQPQLINITPPSNTLPLVGATPDLSTGGSNYNFDSNGNLYRTTDSAITGDCTLATHGYQNAAGSTFYCHTHQYYSIEDYENKSDPEKDKIDNEIQKLRLTFKILDPEVGTCDLSVTGDKKGIIMANPYYLSDPPSNISATCALGTTPGVVDDNSTTDCQNQYYCANKYSNNFGEYYVNVKVKSDKTSSISSIISSVITPVIEVMDGKRDDPDTEDDPATTDIVENDESTVGYAERIYKLLITDSRYKAILTVSLVVLFTFYGVGYLLGVSELNHAQIFGRVIKIGFIYLMVGETGWDWFKMFFVQFFKEGTDYLSFMMASSFDDSPDITSAIESGDLYDKSVLFSSVDNVFNLFFSDAVQKKISALLFASIFGWAYLLIIWWSFLHYVYAVANAVLLYLTAQVFISIMFVVGPIFFIFIIFEQTKEMFDNWIKQLIGFSLQQIFLLITLAFFNMLMYEVIKMSLGFKVCWDEVWVMNLGITRISLLSFWTIASLPPRTNVNSEVGNIGNPEGIPSIFTILFIWVIASLMEQFIGFMTDLASSISGGLKASEMGAGIKSAVSGLNNKFTKLADQAWDKTAGRIMDYADDKLFDSGAAADKRRADIDQKLATDNANKQAMLSAGSEAASKFRKENANNSKLSDAQLADGARKASAAAMVAKAEEMGLSQKETERLMSDKGVKIGGSRTIGGAAIQAFKARRTMNQSLAEQAASAKGSFSRSEANEAKKKMTSEERKEFDERQAKGKISVDRVSFKSVSSSIASSIKQGAGQVVKTVYDKDYANAEKELVEQGEINEMRLRRLTSVSRDNAEKTKIRERAAANKAKKAALETKAITPDEDSIIASMRETEHLDKMDEISDSDSYSATKYLKQKAQKVSTAVKKITPFLDSRKKFKEEMKKIQEDMENKKQDEPENPDPEKDEDK